MRAVRGFVASAARPQERLNREGPDQDGSDAGGHISTEPRINDRIRVPEVRLVGPSGEQVGIVSITDALRLAQEADLDLVEVAPMARPPVCKLMDFGKFKYESALKTRESRKNQAQTVIKEIKIRPKIDPHDYGTKKGHVERFLRQGDKVKVTIMFRGREQSRPELGFVESQPKQDGRNMIMVIGPHRKKAEARAVRSQDRASARAAAPSAHQADAAGHEDAEASQALAAIAESLGVSQAQPTVGQPGDGAAEGTAQPAPRPAAPRPAPPRTASAGAGTARPAAPKPGPAPSTAPAAARPAAPKPSAPRPAAPRSAAPRPAAPRPSAAKPGDGQQSAPQRGRSPEPGANGQEAAG